MHLINLEKTANFYRIYMQLFKAILLFIRATTEQSWELHFYGTQQICMYFFTVDTTNYSQMTPDYLSQKMMKEHEMWWRKKAFALQIWGTVYVNWGIPWNRSRETSIEGVDGIIGIANLSQNLDEYFLSAAEMGNFNATFYDRFDISKNSTCKREDHY